LFCIREQCNGWVLLVFVPILMISFDVDFFGCWPIFGPFPILSSLSFLIFAQLLAAAYPAKKNQSREANLVSHLWNVAVFVHFFCHPICWFPSPKQFVLHALRPFQKLIFPEVVDNKGKQSQNIFPGTFHFKNICFFFCLHLQPMTLWIGQQKMLIVHWKCRHSTKEWNKWCRGEWVGRKWKTRAESNWEGASNQQKKLQYIFDGIWPTLTLP